MAEQEMQKPDTENKEDSEKSSIKKEEDDYVKIVRILQTDIPGNKNLYAGLTRIKGVSWSISNAICKITGMDKNIKVESLSKEDISKIENILKEGKFPEFLENRRKDFETGESKHLLSSDLDLVKEFDVKRLKKIRSYRGLRHALNLPTRGQKTRSNFRKNRKKGMGIKFKKKTENA